MEILTGVIDKLFFSNIEKHFYIGKLDNGTVFLGNLYNPHPGDSVELNGVYVEHKEYGRQFKISNANTLKPNTADAIEKYLCYGPIEGIGPVYAKSIVKYFGDKTLDIIEHNPGRLREVPGIGLTRYKKIVECYKTSTSERTLMMDLFALGLSYIFVIKVLRKYGNEAAQKIKENPYILADDITGIGFKKADSIAKTAGFPNDSPLRLKSAIKFALNNTIEFGHVYLPKSILLTNSKALLDNDSFDVKVEALSIVWDELVKNEGYVCDSDCCYLPNLYNIEVESAKIINSFSTRDFPNIFKNVSSYDKLSDEQKHSVDGVFSKYGLSVITGPAGSGKTYSLRCIIDICKHNDIDFEVCAPTGRAAKRITEISGVTAKTIHRLLGWTRAGFTYNETNKLPVSVLITDESSMTDLPLFYSLLKALRNDVLFILSGDYDQLPSVGVGNVFHDLVHCDKINTFRLNNIFRQKDTSSIIIVSNDIRNGTFNFNNIQPNVEFLSTKDSIDILPLLIEEFNKQLLKGYTYDQIAVLAPMYKGSAGVDNINKVFQDLYNKNGIKIRNTFFRVKDKVMVVRNNYDKDTFNGDMGVIVGIETNEDHKETGIIIKIDDREVVYGFDELTDIKLAFVATVHKMQGSECPVVLFVVSNEHCYILNRNLLYTGITRGIDKTVFIGNMKAFYIGLAKSESRERYSNLGKRIMEYHE